MKNTYRALGIVAVAALLGSVLETALYVFKLTGYGVDYLPPWSSVPGVDIYYYGRTFGELVAINATVIAGIISAAFAIIVAFQSRRTAWAIALIITALLCLAVPPYVLFIAWYGLGLSPNLVEIIAQPEWQSALAILYQLIVIAFVVARVRGKTSIGVIAPVPATTSAM